MSTLIDRSLFIPFEPVVLQFALKSGFYPARLRLIEIIKGPQLRCSDFQAKFEPHTVPRRDLMVSLELMFDCKGVRTNNLILRASQSCSYQWPLPGGAKPVLAEFKRVRLGAGQGVKLLALRPYELLGTVV